MVSNRNSSSNGLFSGVSRLFLGVYPIIHKFISITLPETNTAPENGWLEYSFQSVWGPAYFQGVYHTPPGM